MSDLISKNQSLIEWKEDFKDFVEGLDIPRDDYKGIMEYIDELPSAEPEIIHCKDCKFREKDEIFGGSWCRGYRVRDDHFCGYASRREGEEE